MNENQGGCRVTRNWQRCRLESPSREIAVYSFPPQGPLLVSRSPTRTGSPEAWSRPPEFRVSVACLFVHLELLTPSARSLGLLGTPVHPSRFLNASQTEVITPLEGNSILDSASKSLKGPYTQFPPKRKQTNGQHYDSRLA